MTQHELLRPSQALLARFTLEQVHWHAQRVVQNLDDAQVRIGIVSKEFQAMLSIRRPSMNRTSSSPRTRP